MSLDDKLREILDDALNGGFTEPLVAQIKQAFKHSGWQEPGGGLRGNTMTGQEWYDRFEEELEKQQPSKNLMGTNYYVLDIYEAAKKASGIQDV